MASSPIVPEAVVVQTKTRYVVALADTVAVVAVVGGGVAVLVGTDVVVVGVEG